MLLPLLLPPLLLLLPCAGANIGAAVAPCSLANACLAGVASTIGYFEDNPSGRAQRLSCAQMWSEAVASNSGERSIHHRCPASAGADGAVAWLSQAWQACAADVIAAGSALNVSVCAYEPRFLHLHSLHSDMAVLQVRRSHPALSRLLRDLALYALTG